MKLSGIRLLRIGGIEIIIDFSWLIVFILLVFTIAEALLPLMHPQYSAPQYWIMGFITALLLFVSILIHELAHSIVAIRYGIRVTSIRPLIFGGIEQTTSEPKNGRHEFLIALAGPAASVVLGMLFLMIATVAYFTAIPYGKAAAEIAVCSAGGNILLAVLNMIPGFPLDGGRILRAFLWDHWGDLARATKVVSQLGNSFALFLIILGAMLILKTQSMVFGLWLIFVGLFMKQSAAGSYQAVMLRRALVGVQVKQIMTENVISVDWLMPIDQLINDFVYKHQFTNFPVFNRDEFIGMVSLEGVKTISKELWGFKQVRDIMTPIEFVTCLNPADDATEALSKMITGDIGHMPVVENGRLLGIVSRRDIMSLFKIKSDLGVA